MNIDEMTPEEKSVALAKLCGWEIWYYGDTDKVSSIVDNSGATIFYKHGECSPVFNLYDPANMPLLAKVVDFFMDVAKWDNPGLFSLWDSKTFFRFFRSREMGGLHGWMKYAVDYALLLHIEAGLLPLQDQRE